MRQRLSSEPDRYRGRRRVPTPPRSRYAAVVTSAFVGAGVVALGAASQLPDAKAVNPTVLQNLEAAPPTTRSPRRTRRRRRPRLPWRGARRRDARSATRQAEAEAWLLPLEDYEFTAPYGVRFGKLHAGIDLAAPEGTPYKAVHAGTVTSAGYSGGYGYAVTIQHADGTEMIYAPLPPAAGPGRRRRSRPVRSSARSATPATRTAPTCTSRCTSTASRPTRSPSCATHGVDIKLRIESVYGALAAS